MIKIINIFLFLAFLSNSYAIDIQNKIHNSDKSYFETITIPQNLNKNQMMMFLNYSVLKNPVLDDKNNPYIDGLQNIDASFIYGLSNKIELGTNLSYKQTLSSESSFFESYSGLSELLVEGKYQYNKHIALTPQYIFSLNDGIPLSGPTSGYGLKLSTGILQESKLPFFFNISGYQFAENRLRNIDQSSRIFYSLGTLYSINKDFDLGVEFFHDISKSHSPKEIISHLTFDNNNFLLRSGMGLGLNEYEQNEFRFLITLGLSFDFSNKNKKDRMNLNNDFLLREINSYEEEEMSIDTDKLKRMASNSSIIEDEDLDEHTVLPFYTVKEIREIVRKEENKKEISSEIIKEYEERQERIKKSEETLAYFVELHKKNRINDEKALVEFSWGIRVLNMRKKAMDDFLDKLDESTVKELNTRNKESELEKYAKDFVKNNKKKLMEIRNDLKKQNKKDNESVASIKKESVEEEIIVEEIDFNKLTPEQEEIKKKQEIAWEISKTKTLQDLIKEGLYSPEKKIIKDRKKISPPKIESLIDHVLLKESEIKEKDLKVDSLLNKINEKLNLKIETPSYQRFYDNYKEGILNGKTFKMKPLRNEKEEIRFIDEEVTEIKEEKSSEESDNNLKEYKILSIKKVSEEESVKSKENFMNEFYENNKNYEDSVIYDDGYIEKSSGPSY